LKLLRTLNHIKANLSNAKRGLVNKFGFILVFTLLGVMANKVANAEMPAKQNIAEIKTKVQSFLQNQVIGYPGKTNINVGAIDPNVKLAHCPNIEIFMPSGSRAWGQTSVGVRCSGQNNWTIYVQATVNVYAQYLVAAAPLSQGMIISQEHCLFENGDLTRLPAGIFTELSQTIGRTVNISVPAGTVLRQDILKLSPIVQRGQTVTLTSSGLGFKVAAEGQALGNATEGQVVQVKVASGQVVTGVARIGGQIEVKF